MLMKPVDRRIGIHMAQVHDQVDRTTAAFGQMPIEEFGSGDRKRPTLGAPLRSVTPVTLRSPPCQHDGERDRADRIGSPTELVECHRALLFGWVP